ncbi:hypothetical protein OS31_24970 [Dickeya oryzae]
MRYGMAFLISLLLGGLVVSADAASVKNDNSAYVFLHADSLAQVKQQLRDQAVPAQRQLAYQQLLRAADSAMKKPDLTVTQKLSIPPGGGSSRLSEPGGVLVALSRAKGRPALGAT